MKILSDQVTPKPLKIYLPAREVVLASELGWGTLKNGELLSAAGGALWGRTEKDPGAVMSIHYPPDASVVSHKFAALRRGAMGATARRGFG
jgi:hypothetical protein